MKKTLTLIAFMLLLSPIVSFAQDETDKIFNRVKINNPNATQPNFILKVDNKTLVFNKQKHEDIDLNYIDPDTIQEIKVFKGDEALTLGDNPYGLVVITFKNLEDISPSLKKKFESL